MPRNSKKTNSDSAKHIINSLKQSFLYKNENVQEERLIWEREYSSRVHNHFSEEQLFSPSEYRYRHASHIDSGLSSNHKGVDIVEFAKLGFWGLIIIRDHNATTKHNQKWDFTIAAKVANRFVFHPLEARNNILRYHSEMVYQKWRQTVNEDLERFKDVLNSYNPPRHLVSTACSRSSERVCRRLNLHVSDGRAFLLHKKNQECLHKNGTFALNFTPA